jgi:hypothetical protein
VAAALDDGSVFLVFFLVAFDDATEGAVVIV